MPLINIGLIVLEKDNYYYFSSESGTLVYLLFPTSQLYGELIVCKFKVYNLMI